MPFACRYFPAQRFGVATLSGEVDGAQFLAAIRSLYGDPAWEPGFSALWDARRVMSLPMDLEAVEAISALTDTFGGRMGSGRAAFVVPHELHRMIAVLLVYRTSTPERERRVFEELEPALAWLGIAAGALEGEAD